MNKMPFVHQVTDYDCVPATFVNALIHLFERREIPPLVLQRIYHYCFDCSLGRGTSSEAVQVLAQWLGEYRDPDSAFRAFALRTEYLEGGSVHLKQGNRIARCLSDKGVALLDVTDRAGLTHYVLALSINDDWVHCYDSYYQHATHRSAPGRYEYISEQALQSHNIRIHRNWLENTKADGRYRLGSLSKRSGLLIRRA